MRFLTPSVAKVSTQSHSGNPRHTRHEALPKIPQVAFANSKPSVLAAVVARRRLRSNVTPTNAIGRSPSQSVFNAPKKPANNQSVIASDSLGQTTFCDWYETLTPDKRTALMMSMVAVCNERDDSHKADGGIRSNEQDDSHKADGGIRSGNEEMDPTMIAFQWHIEQDEDCLVFQFREWYSSLSAHEQNTALAYSALTGGMKVDGLPTLDEWDEDEEQEIRQISATKDKSANAKAFGKRPTREAFTRLLGWAQSYVQDSPVVVPNMPEGIQTEELTRDPDYPVVDYPLPQPPAPGYRAKLTRNGTLVLDNWGETVFEKIPNQKELKAKARAN